MKTYRLFLHLRSTNNEKREYDWTYLIDADTIFEALCIYYTDFENSAGSIWKIEEVNE